MLSLRSLAYTFADNHVRAVDDLSLDLAPGMIHAVIGENGAGKSTLARLCTGHLVPQAGSLALDGQELRLASPACGLDAGLALVPQHPRLAPSLSVWQNLVLGRLPDGHGQGRFGRLRKGPLLDSLHASLQGWGIHLPLELPAGHLDAAHMHWAAIAEALLAKPTHLFLDEPSAPYSPQEVERLYRLLRRCAEGGMCVAVITHRLQEVVDWADAVHVLRRGRLVADFGAGRPLGVDRLVEAMFGEAAIADEAPASPASPAEAAPPGSAASAPPASPALHIAGLRVNDGAGRILNGLELEAPAGRVTGLIGIKDQGLDILEDVLAGLVRPSAGSLSWEGKPLSRLEASRRAYIPGKRFQRGIAGGLSIGENLSSRNRRWLHPFNRRSGSRWRTWRAASGFDLDRSWSDGITTLSGGMIQRLIFERELDNPPPALVVCCEPYWGLDRHFQSVLRRRLRQLAAGGAAVLVLSSDLDEAMDLADRLHVVHNGRRVLSMDKAEYERDSLATAMVHSPGGPP